MSEKPLSERMREGPWQHPDGPQAACDDWASEVSALESRVAEAERQLAACTDECNRNGLALVESIRDNTALREAAGALVRQMRLMNADPKYQSVWTLYAIHGGVYDGERCADELEALDAALAPLLKEVGR